jgi:two-component system cell cycle sensor histidine kinase/response regulator CckA
MKTPPVPMPGVTQIADPSIVRPIVVGAAVALVTLLIVLSGSRHADLLVLLILPGVLWRLIRRRRAAKALSAEVERLGHTLADQGRELGSVRAERDQRAREADALLEIALATGSTLDEEELLRHIARGAARACRAERCTVYLLDESGEWLTPAMSQRADGSVDDETWRTFTDLGTPRLRAVPFLQEAVLTRAPVRIVDAGLDVRVPRRWVELFRLRSLLAVPLIRLGRAVGVVVLDLERPLPPDEAALAVTLAEQIALAMQNAGLYRDAEARRREAEIMAEVIAAINGSLDMDTVLRRIAEGARELCRSEIAAVALRDPASRAMVLRYHTAGAPLRRLLGTDHQGEARRIGEEYAAVMREEGLVAALVVSIRSEQGMEGLLYVGNHSPRPFTARDRAVLAHLAEPATIAITNGRLFEAAQTRLHRMARLTTLSQLMVSSLDYRQVLHFVTGAALDLLGGDLVRLWVLDEEGRRLRLASWEARGEAPGDGASGAELPVGGGIVGWVVQHRAKRYSANLSQDPLLSRQEWPLSGTPTSQLAVPLIVGERALGALVVVTKARPAFSPEDEELLELFAAQAAAALENARLYAEAQQAYAELARTQAQLTHAQKMEAVGRLAGGVAHDFNNLLTVIQGRAEQLLDALPPADPLWRQADLIQKTGDRAAALTQQLLAFSRKQLRQPRVLDLNALVADLEKMLRRVIGEDIAIELALDPALGRVRADVSQIGQVALNLAVNARDAMPRGGALVIRTANVDVPPEQDGNPLGPPSGRWVVLEVRDTGIGMDAETRLRIFEPFFTTKEPGKGTGLGLATVYGIVQQSDGHIDVESAPGHGTTFRIYLPRVESAPETREIEPSSESPVTGDETLLLLEDEGHVRRVVRESLTRWGYTVLEAARAHEALAIAERHPGRIDLLITDVIMPGMSGPDVARSLVGLRPGLKVLYVSGYADDALGQHGVLEPDVAFLPKPFTVRELARKVRAVLDHADVTAKSAPRRA